MAKLVRVPALQQWLKEKTPANRSPLNLKVASEQFLCLGGGRDGEELPELLPCRSQVGSSTQMRF